jgi:hypothetical protein
MESSETFSLLEGRSPSKSETFTGLELDRGVLSIGCIVSDGSHTRIRLIRIDGDVSDLKLIHVIDTMLLDFLLQHIEFVWFDKVYIGDKFERNVMIGAAGGRENLETSIWKFVRDFVRHLNECINLPMWINPELEMPRADVFSICLTKNQKILEQLIDASKMKA